MHLVVGLGNPGAKYEKTRHNIGWRVIDELVARHAFGGDRSEKRAMTWDGRIGGARVKLAKPLTFMNRSGEAVRSLTDYYRIPLEEILVVHDDLDTPYGALKLRRAGGHGGQNGIRSIVQHLGSKDFARLRFGIGRPPGRMDPIDYVLQTFNDAERDALTELVGRGADAIEAWLRHGIERAMSDFNGDGSAKTARPSAGDLEAKLRIAERARQLAPYDPKPVARVIALQKKLGMLDAAVDNHLHLAGLYDRANQSGLATAEMAKATTMKPSLVEVQRQIAERYQAQGNGKKAVARLLILARHYEAQGEARSAIETVDEALALNPQHPKALDMRRELEGVGAKAEEAG